MSVISIKPGETLVVIALAPEAGQPLPEPQPPVDPGYSPPWATVPDVPVEPTHPWVPPEPPTAPVDPGYSPPWAQLPVDPGYGIPEKPPVPPAPDGGPGNWTWAWCPTPPPGRWAWVRVPASGEAGPKKKK